MRRRGTPLQIEARQAAVANGLLEHKTFEAMAEEFDVSVTTIFLDKEAIKKQWKETYGDVKQMFDQQAMELDQFMTIAMVDMLGMAPADRPATMALWLRAHMEKSKLFGLHRRPGSGDDDMPTGPIEINIHWIKTGNRKLVTEGDDASEFDDDLALEGDEYEQAAELRKERVTKLARGGEDT